ncbi:MAG: hypothetical protein AB8G14_03570 [Ilumatobacter sp.]
MVETNHQFNHGDRVRHETIGDDGFPLVRYGFVGGQTHGDGPVVVMLDGELGGDVVDLCTLQPVDISTVTLTLSGSDLLDDLLLREGLVKLWHAEAEDAGLQIAGLHPVETGLSLRDTSEGVALAELVTADEQYVLRATRCNGDDAVVIAASRPNRWIF